MISRLKTLHLESRGSINRASELLGLVAGINPGELALAGEVPVCGYENLGESFEVNLIKNIINSLKVGAYFGFTHLNEGYNEFVLLSNKGELYKQKKAVLFEANNEQNFFKAGRREDINLFELDGIKIGVLICFELRFCELWARLRGAEIILVPALWAKARAGHFEVLCEALALQNRCYVLACSDYGLKFGRVFRPDGSSEASSEFEPEFAKRFKSSLGIADGSF